jgi:hypothetical protein
MPDGEPFSDLLSQAHCRTYGELKAHYRVGTNDRPLDRALQRLRKKGLLTFDKRTRIWKRTEEGTNVHMAADR